MNNKIIIGLFIAFAVIVFISSLQNTAFMSQTTSQNPTVAPVTQVPTSSQLSPTVAPTITLAPTLPPPPPIQRTGGFRIQGAGGEDD